MSLFDLSSLWKAVPPNNSTNNSNNDNTTTTSSSASTISTNSTNSSDSTPMILKKVPCITDVIKDREDTLDTQVQTSDTQGEAEMEIDDAINTFNKQCESICITDAYNEWDQECSRIRDLSYADESEVLEELVNEVLSLRSIPTSPTTEGVSDEDIRNRAYHIWLETGCSDEVANYYKAEAELRSITV